MVGATLSSTVTVAVQKEELPLASVTNKVTVFAPKSSQSKELDGVRAKVTGPPQPSEEPLSTSAAVMVTLPVASN